MNYKLFILVLSIYLFSCKSKPEESDAYGNFETETVLVSAESSGKILELNIERGQQMERDFMAVLVDTVPLKLRMIQLDAQKALVESKRQAVHSRIEVFKVQKETLAKNEKRTIKMLEDGASTQKQLDDIQGQMCVLDKQIASTKTEFVSITKELEVLDAQKEFLQDQLMRCFVKSPMKGTILETYVEQGELTTTGKTLFKMADLSELKLKVYVSGAQLPNIKLGQSVEVLIDKTDRENQTLTGKISWISSEAEFTPKIIQTKEERVKLVYAVHVLVKNDGTLKMGMPGEVNF